MESNSFFVSVAQVRFGSGAPYKVTVDKITMERSLFFIWFFYPLGKLTSSDGISPCSIEHIS